MPATRRGIGEGVRSSVGDAWLASASDSDLFWLTAGGVIGGVVGGEVAFALTGSVLLAGAAGGAGEYYGLRLAVNELGGETNDFSLQTVGEFVAGGAIGGVRGAVIGRVTARALAPATAPLARGLSHSFSRLPQRTKGVLLEAFRFGQTRVEIGLAQAPPGVVVLHSGLPFDVRITPPSRQRILASAQEFFEKQKPEFIENLLAIDSNAKLAIRGSTVTGKVGNPRKLAQGKTLFDPNDFDLDLFILSDIIDLGPKVRPLPILRAQIFKSNPQLFKGLRVGGEGVSVKSIAPTDDFGEALFFQI